MKFNESILYNLINSLKIGADDHGCPQKFSLREGGANPKKDPYNETESSPHGEKSRPPPHPQRETSSKKAPYSCLYNRFALNFTRTIFF